MHFPNQFHYFKVIHPIDVEGILMKSGESMVALKREGWRDPGWWPGRGWHWFPSHPLHSPIIVSHCAPPRPPSFLRAPFQHTVKMTFASPTLSSVWPPRTVRMSLCCRDGRTQEGRSLVPDDLGPTRPAQGRSPALPLHNWPMSLFVVEASDSLYARYLA